MKSKKTNYKKKLDQLFSVFIRLRDSDEFGNCKCITCGKVEPWKRIQNGHWISRGVLNTRYNELNCHSQCVGCNLFGDGKPHLHEMYIVGTHGAEVRDQLLENSKIIKPKLDYIALIEHYSKEVERLKQKIWK